MTRGVLAGLSNQVGSASIEALSAFYSNLNALAPAAAAPAAAAPAAAVPAAAAAVTAAPWGAGLTPLPDFVRESPGRMVPRSEAGGSSASTDPYRGWNYGKERKAGGERASPRVMTLEECYPKIGSNKDIWDVDCSSDLVKCTWTDENGAYKQSSDPDLLGCMHCITEELGLHHHYYSSDLPSYKASSQLRNPNKCLKQVAEEFDKPVVHHAKRPLYSRFSGIR